MLSYLQALHRYLIVACANPAYDEDVHELRRQRRQVAELIAGWKEPGPC
jgi:hypothetical protein